ncbi:alpha-crystallin A chain-like [Schistocerca piceifrons]|uniref:alpha-crystallin A chain-like n=1 Tax=Schistocerca piceifrons TaxID=274613 RepID=UPI001F5EB726|nr:alpha-crystallin A chain-like [Schistocerca piceifrons]
MSQRRICYWPGQTDWARGWLFLDLDDSDSDSDDELNVARLGATTSCYDPSAALDACCCSYNRPWRHTPEVKSGFSKIERSKDGFKVTLDVQHFKEGDLKVKVVGNQVVVEAEHDERQDEHGLISRSLRRKYALPDNVDIEKVASELSSDGILTITAPKKIMKGLTEEDILKLLDASDLEVSDEDDCEDFFVPENIGA